jgi:hypothetical protein
MRTDYETVTPQQAADWLRIHNRGNRVVYPSRVAALAKEMVQGTFKLTHQGIAFDKTARLIDGQHRLLAIVKANVPVTLAVTRGAGTDIYLAIDQGRAKSTADIFGLDKKVAQVVRLAAHYMGDSVTQSGVAQWIPVVAPTAEWLRKGAKSSPARVGSAATVLAAVVQILAGADKSYVKSVFSSLVNGDYAQLPPIALSFAGQATSGRINVTDKQDVIVKSLIVFDSEKANITKLSYKSAEGYIAFLRETLFAAQSNIGLQTGDTLHG